MVDPVTAHREAVARELPAALRAAATTRHVSPLLALGPVTVNLALQMAVV